MDTIGVPFMVNFEAKHIIYPYIKEMSLMDLRYIDGIYMLWKGAKAGLMIFIKELNEKHKFIKFDFQILPRKTVIFDAMLYKDGNKNIETTLYHKPTTQQAFLHNKSKDKISKGHHPV